MSKGKKKFFLHPTSFADQNVFIDKGTKIWHYCHLMKGVKIGRNCQLGQNVFVGENVVIGNNVKVQNNVSIFSGVTLQDDVFCGPGVVFTNVKFPRSRFPVNKNYLPTLVKKGATIGANATLVCPLIIGSHAFIGAGSVVTKEVFDYQLVFGNPAQLKGYVCQCGSRLSRGKKDKKIDCQKCDRIYCWENDQLKLLSAQKNHNILS